MKKVQNSYKWLLLLCPILIIIGCRGFNGLIKSSESPDWRDRQDAAIEIATLLKGDKLNEKEREAALQMLHRLLSDDSTIVRATTLTALRSIENEKIVGWATTCLEDEQPIVRQEALKLLARKDNEQVVERVMKLIEDDPDVLVRVEAVYTLAAIGTDSAVEALTEASKNSNTAVAFAASASLHSKKKTKK